MAAMTKRPIIYAHRGASDLYPENTMAAFKNAEQAADGVELDIHLTRDNVIVVCHDPTIDRTSNGHGAISSYTYDELLAFDFGRGEKIPTLLDVLKLCESKKMALNIELKLDVDGKRHVGMEQATVDLVRNVFGDLESYPGTDWPAVIYSSFSEDIIDALYEADPNAKVGLLCEGLTAAKPFAKLKRHNYYAIHPNKHVIDMPLYMKRCKNRGLKVNVWTINSVQEITRAIRAGVDGIITNDPNLARTLVGR